MKQPVGVRPGTAASRLRSLIRRQPMTLIGLLLILAMTLIGLAAPYLAPHDPVEINLPQRLAAPSTEHLMGTDTFGRDVLSRVIYGARISLWVGFFSVLLGAGLGVPIGALSGYLGGKLDILFMRIMDMMMAFPALILAMAIAASLGPGLRNAVIAVGIVAVPRYARLIRSAVLEVKGLDYVTAARSLGASDWRILYRHVLRNCLSPVIVQGTLGLGQAIITAAGLSFIGLGAQPPMPEWGAIITEGRYYVVSGRWWLSIFPGMAIALSVLGFNLAGDGLRDLLDPRLKT